MVFKEAGLDGSFIIQPDPFKDHRGFFARWYCEEQFREHGLCTRFVQSNHSGTAGKGSIRGMHFQYPPHAEIKLVKCIVGGIYDVIIDIRRGSPTFLKWVGVELTAENMQAIYVPKGFAHGFQTLTEQAEIIYMVSDFYQKGAEGGLRFNDEAVDIKWPLPLNKISEKDMTIRLTGERSFEGVVL